VAAKKLDGWKNLEKSLGQKDAFGSAGFFPAGDRKYSNEVDWRSGSGNT